MQRGSVFRPTVGASRRVFRGIYNLRQLEDLYGRLPMVDRAGPAMTLQSGAPKPNHICVRPDGDVWRYVLATGDWETDESPSPTPDIVGVFSVSADGTPTPITHWNENVDRSPYPSDLIDVICGM